MRAKFLKMGGFSLMELMIALAIAALLATVAVPSYQEYVKKTRRGVAQGDLMGLASALERYYVDNHTFVGADPAAVFSNKSPVDGNERYYTLTITATRRDFTAQAAPYGLQADDQCGTLTLTRSGVRDVVGATASEPEKCWPG